MICAYYTRPEIDACQRVKDKELNDLLQEVRDIEDRYYVQERTYIAKKWIGKPVETTLYTVLINRGGMDCQLWNFPSEGESSICTEVPKSYVITLFLGFLNGYKTKFDY